MVSLVLLGALVGSILMGFLSEYYGKRRNIMLADLIMIISSIFFLYPNTICFAIGRILAGVSSGALIMLCAQYNSEFTPKDATGKMGSLGQLFGMSGMLIGLSVCLALPERNCDLKFDYFVLIMFSVPGIVAFIQFLIFLQIFDEESPLWLLKEGKNDEAKKSMESIYDENYAEIELQKIINSDHIHANKTFSTVKLLSSKKGSGKAMRLGILFHVLQQTSGIKAILSYTTKIFESFGEGVLISRVFSIIVSLTRILAVFALFPIIDKSGRKKITVVSEFIMGICFVLLTACIHFYNIKLLSVVLIDLYLVFFAISMGPIC